MHKYRELRIKIIRLTVIPVMLSCLALIIAFAVMFNLQSSQTHEEFHRQINNYFSLKNIDGADQNFILNELDIRAKSLISAEGFTGITWRNSDTKQIVNTLGIPFESTLNRYSSTSPPPPFWQEGNLCFYYLDLQKTSGLPLELFVTKSHLGDQIQVYRVSIILLIIASLCTIFIFWSYRKFKSDLINPIEKMSEGIQQIKDGKIEVLATSSKEGIYGTLAEELNGLIKKLSELEKKQSESSEDELRETLETVEIQNIELDLARKNAVQVNRVKTEFLASISHEIRTPLNGIIGFTELLNKTDLSPQQNEYLTTIDESAKGLLTIISDILDFSRLEMGKLTLEYKPTRIRQVVEDAVKLHALSAQEKNLRLLTIIDNDIPEHLLGDPLRLKQVLNNLISNSIKFTNTGHILISVSKKELDNSRLRLKFRITDSGIGLTQEQQESLFDVLTQLDSSENRTHGGTGLGLAIAKGLVDRMDGQIGVESDKDSGATFWFTSTLGLNSKAIQNQNHLSGTLKHTKIFIYDCDALARSEISHYLRGWGAKVVDESDFDSIATRFRKSIECSGVQLALIDAQYDKKIFDKRKLQALIDTLNNEFSIPVIVIGPPKLQRQIEPIVEDSNNAFMNRPIYCSRLYQLVCEYLGIVSPHEQVENKPKKTNKVIQKNVRVLAVDDNPANLRLVLELLKELQVDCFGASSGAEALKMLQKSSFDLVLMDIQMPDMDGLEATQKLRSLEAPQQRTPVVALTAHAVSDQKSKLLLAGLDDYLTKPVSENELRHIIERWVSRHTEVEEKTHTSKKPLQIPQNSSIQNESENKDLVDLMLCLSLTKNKADLAKDMLAMLLESLPTARQDIQNFAAANQLKDLQEVVHKLHGGACYCGVPRLKSVSQSLDKTLINTIKAGQEIENLPELSQDILHTLDALIEWGSKNDLNNFFGLANAAVE